MRAGVGVTVGSADSTAVVCDTPTSRSPQVRACPTELFVDTEFGGQTLTGFATRVGDPVGILADDGSVHLGENLVAGVVAHLVTDVDGAPVTVAHPAWWSAHAVTMLDEALHRTGVTATTMPEPVAAALWAEQMHGDAAHDTTLVYDLGARSLDVTVVRAGEVVGRAVTSGDVSGDHLDHLVTAYVLDALGADTLDMDPFAPANISALSRFREQCRAAREALSADTETVLPVDLPGIRRDVRLVRGEIEEFARGPLTESTAVVDDALHSAGVDASEIGRVLLVGGVVSTPLVAEALSSHLGLPITMGAQPTTTAAHGAALAAAQTAPLAAPAPGLPAVGQAEAPTTEIPTAVHRPAVIDPPTRTTKPRTRTFALAGAAAAVIALLAGGGLALGTMSSSDAETPNPSTVAEIAPVETPGSDSPPTPGNNEATPLSGNGDGPAARTVTPVGSGGNGTSASTTRTEDTVSTPREDRTANSPATPGTATPDTSAPEVPAVAPVPAPTGPLPAAPAAPAPAPAPAPQPDNRVGDALSGAGQGAGALVEGVGSGLGNVLEGTGNVVGGVVGGTGEVVGGLLGGGR